MIEFGASFHATFQKEYSIHYVPVDYKNMPLGNEHLCGIMGTDTIKVKLHNDGQWVLKEATHIPDLK